jgi:hypothetical protein
MHSNAEYVYQLNETDRMLRSLLNMMPKKRGGGGEAQPLPSAAASAKTEAGKKTEEKKDSARGKESGTKPKVGSSSSKMQPAPGKETVKSSKVEKTENSEKTQAPATPDNEVMTIARVCSYLIFNKKFLFYGHLFNFFDTLFFFM